MKPHEFWNCTYREVSLYVQSFYKQQEYEFKNQISLLEALSDKILVANPYIVKNSKFTTLRSVFDNLFEDSKQQSQSIEEQIRNMRLRM